jgi:hypothetical protein
MKRYLIMTKYSGFASRFRFDLMGKPEIKEPLIFDTLEDALQTAEKQFGTCTIVELLPVAQVTCETIVRKTIDPLL